MTDDIVLAIIDKFSAADIAELELNSGDFSLTLRKAGAVGNEASNKPDRQNARPEQSAEKDVAGTGGKTELIVSPIVATFYSSADPSSPPFAQVGSTVKAGTTLCILEAMKMMNHLEAEFDCEITAVLAKSGDLVEFGQTLFEVKRL
ncbi:hypothetical protein FACS1894151_06890 [Spirochaetia bacterium]|nr:hypothetical protein FACS1894151_06890 [Spirochaetia bacterium]